MIWSKWCSISRDQQELYIMFVGLIVAYLWFLGPSKKNYKNIYDAWIVCLILLVCATGCLWLLFTYKIFPYTYGFGFLDQIYWMILTLAFCVAVQRSMVAITILLNLRKSATEENLDN